MRFSAKCKHRIQARSRESNGADKKSEAFGRDGEKREALHNNRDVLFSPLQCCCEERSEQLLLSDSTVCQTFYNSIYNSYIKQISIWVETSQRLNGTHKTPVMCYSLCSLILHFTTLYAICMVWQTANAILVLSAAENRCPNRQPWDRWKHLKHFIWQN